MLRTESVDLTRPQIKTLYHQMGAVEATHPKACVELRQDDLYGPVHAIITCASTCHPVGRCNWRLDLHIGANGALIEGPR